MLGRMLEEGEGKDRRRDEHMQKMPLISPMSVIKSHPCCLPQFPLVSAEDEHVHLAHRKLESGPKEQSSSHAGAASLQEGTAGWKTGAGA